MLLLSLPLLRRKALRQAGTPDYRALRTTNDSACCERTLQRTLLPVDSARCLLGSTPARCAVLRG